MADAKISDLTLETSLSDNDLFELSTDEGGGVRDSRKIPASSIKTYMNTGGTGTSIKTLVFRIPTMKDDSALHFALEVFLLPDYSGTAVESFNTATSSTNIKVSDGSEWISYPSNGVGTPFYSNRLSVSLQVVVSGTQYYIRFKFFAAGSLPGESPWEYSQYPVLDVDLYTPDKTGSIKSLAFRIPVMTDDSALQFAIDVFTTADYSGTALESYNTENGCGNVLVSSGSSWIEFPSEGVGNPYYSNRLSVQLLFVESGVQYYIRFKFFAAGSVVSETPWEYSPYPVLDVSLYEPDKKVKNNVVTESDNATATINVDVTDVFELSAVVNSTTFTVVGSPTDGQCLLIRLKDAGVVKDLVWDSSFAAIGVTKPSVTVQNKWMYVFCQYNLSAVKWHITSVSIET